MDITLNARYLLPSGRLVRIVSMQGSTATCVYTTPWGEPSYRDDEATVSLTAAFLRAHGKPVGELVAQA